MFCRLALVALVACIIIYPVETVGTITDAWFSLMDWAGQLGYAAAEEMANRGYPF
jgi:hypothetical protein